MQPYILSSSEPHIVKFSLTMGRMLSFLAFLEVYSVPWFYLMHHEERKIMKGWRRCFALDLFLRTPYADAGASDRSLRERVSCAGCGS